MAIKARRHSLRKIETSKPDVEVHVSILVLETDDPDESYDYLEIREFNTAAEMPGHGIVIPTSIAPQVYTAIYEVLGESE